MFPICYVAFYNEECPLGFWTLAKEKDYHLTISWWEKLDDLRTPDGFYRLEHIGIGIYMALCDLLQHCGFQIKNLIMTGYGWSKQQSRQVANSGT